MTPILRKLICLSLLVSVAACGPMPTTQGYRQQSLESFRGAPEETLIQAWGVPDRSYELRNGNKILQYNRYQQEVVAYGGPYYSTGYGWGGRHHYSAIGATYIFHEPDTIVTRSCETTFTLNRKRRVIDYNFNGALCLAHEQQISYAPAEDDSEAALQADAIRRCNDKLPQGTVGERFRRCVESEMRR
jgi:hypothetical protein